MTSSRPARSRCDPSTRHSGRIRRQDRAGGRPRIEGYAAPRLVEYTCEDLQHRREGCACGCATDALLDLALSTAMDQLPGLLDQLDIGFGSYDKHSLGRPSGIAGGMGRFGRTVPAPEQSTCGRIRRGRHQLHLRQSRPRRRPKRRHPAQAHPVQLRVRHGLAPIRLGTLNAGGSQDVVMHVITDTGARWYLELPRVRLRERLHVRRTRARFVQHLLRRHVLRRMGPKRRGAGYVTEYLWAPTACDPCTGGGR